MRVWCCRDVKNPLQAVYKLRGGGDLKDLGDFVLPIYLGIFEFEKWSHRIFDDHQTNK